MHSFAISLTAIAILICLQCQASAEDGKSIVRKFSKNEQNSVSPSIGKSSLTFVTALFDIKRDKWPRCARNMTKYRSDMIYVLRFRTPMVIFVDPENYEFVTRTRSEFGLGNITRVHRMRFDELPMHSQSEHIEKIHFRELNTTGGWKAPWDEGMKRTPEVFSADYDILVNSKPYFIHTVSVENPFGTEFFSWLDAGFAHSYPERWKNDSVYDWRPKLLNGKISMIKRTTKMDKVSRYQLADLYHRDIPEVINAGLIGGDQKAIATFNRLFYEQLNSLLNNEMIEDEQVIFVLVAAHHPELFNLVDKDCGPNLFDKGDQCATQGDAFTLFYRRLVRAAAKNQWDEMRKAWSGC